MNGVDRERRRRDGTFSPRARAKRADDAATFDTFCLVRRRDASSPRCAFERAAATRSESRGVAARKVRTLGSNPGSRSWHALAHRVAIWRTRSARFRIFPKGIYGASLPVMCSALDDRRGAGRVGRRRGAATAARSFFAQSGFLLFFAGCTSTRAVTGADDAVDTAGEESTSEATRYLSEEAFRRAELSASLVTTTNDYAALRLAHYAGGDRRWESLPEWNPRVDVVRAAELDDGTAARATMSAQATALAVDSVAIDDDAMRALGERAFFRYPTQLAAYAKGALGSRAAAARYGLWVDEARGVNGFVRAELADGSAGLSLSCASCHARWDGTTVVAGVGNDALDLGRLVAEASDAPASSPFFGWGRGRVDVTTEAGSLPVRTSDLRPTRWLTHLHHDATVAKRDRTALAIRLETLIITSHGEAVRPPRAVTWALAVFLESLADALSFAPPRSAAATRGAATFGALCVGCHAPPGLTGAPVPLAAVGTDPSVGLSPDRGTGLYRVPSLRGVGSRPLLLHDASIPTLEALFDPTRLTAAFESGLRGMGPVLGHAYGLELGPAERADLVAFLRDL
jgi:hypothetical protein